MSDAEFLEKLRYLHAYETRIFGAPTGEHEFRSIVSRLIVTSFR